MLKSEVLQKRLHNTLKCKVAVCYRPSGIWLPGCCCVCHFSVW